MSFDKQLMEILDKTSRRFSETDSFMMPNEAHKAIKELIRESLPEETTKEEWEIYYGDKAFPYSVGFNQCRSELLERLGE